MTVMTQRTASSHLNAPDAPTRLRMLAAFDLAVRRVGGHPGPTIEQVWGWRGRTLSGPIIVGSAVTWLRLASGRTGEISRTFWRGNITAEQQIPADVPRPRLLHRDEWESGPWRYAAEAFEHTVGKPFSQTPAPSGPLPVGSLPDAWWSELRRILDVVGDVTTRRFTIGPVWAEQLLADHFGSDQAASSPWITCHGDLHWANLAGPDLVVFDWEGWGGGPDGYDAASLLVHSLLQPGLAAEVRDRFAGVLDGERGRYAQQVVVVEQLWRRRDTPDDPLLPALDAYADSLR